MYHFTTNHSPEHHILEVTPGQISPEVGPILKPRQTEQLITEYINNEKPSVQEGDLD